MWACGDGAVPRPDHPTTQSPDCLWVPPLSCVTILVLILDIEKLIYGGDGLARVPADAAPAKGASKQKTATKTAQPQGKAAFVPFVLEGERVEAKILEEKPGFIRAQAEKIVKASPERIAPNC